MYKVLSPAKDLLLTLLAMVDYKKRFVDLEIGWPGSVGDGRIWSCSTLKKVYKPWLSQVPMTSLATGSHPDGHEISEEIPPFILADSAYSNTRHMVQRWQSIPSRSIWLEIGSRLIEPSKGLGSKYRASNRTELKLLETR